MIYITGDCHTPIDIKKLTSKYFDSSDLTRDDIVIICGDMGIVWSNYEKDRSDIYWQKWFDNKQWTTLFVDGNHENHDRLDKYPVTQYCGGNVHMITPNVIHLMRGQVYDIKGKTFFTMGGAVSHDKLFRKENIDWWAREMPNKAEYDTALDNLAKHNNTVDYIITHCAPSSLHKRIDCMFKDDQLTDFFDEIYKTVKFKCWYFGHYHVDNVVADNAICVYNKIHKI